MYITNLTHNSFSCVGCLFLFSTCFRHLVCIPEGHLHRVTYTRCRIDKINSPDDGHVAVRNIYLLTPWCRVLLEQLTGLQLVKKFPHISRNPKVHYRTHKRPPHVSILGQPNPVHIPTADLLEIRPILPTHLRLCLPSGFFPSGFPTKNLYTPLSSPIRELQFIN